MARTWKFNSKRKSRDVQSFADFAGSSFAVDAMNAIDNTHLGEKIITHIGYERSIGISVENMGNCYGHYVPKRRNLKSEDNPDYEGLDGLVLIDKKDVDQTFLPFIFTHEGFHTMQDRNEFSGLVPMYNNGVIYNAKYRLGEKKDFVRAFKTMERACDVVAVCVAWEMKKNGLGALFSELSNNDHTRDMALCIEDAGEWAIDQSKSSKDDVMDFCMFWGNMAGLWSEKYNSYLDRAAEKTFKTTEKSIFFSTLETLPVAPQIEFAHFCLISETFGPRRWDIDGDFEAIEKHCLARKNKSVIEKTQRVQSAMRLAEDRQKNPNRYPDLAVS